MKHNYLKVALVATLAGVMFTPCQAGLFSKTTAEKRRQLRDKELKEKKKEYSRDGWKLTGTSHSLDVALFEYFEKLYEGDNRELAGEVSACKSINVCKQAAYNQALITYANLAGSSVRGLINSDINSDQSNIGSEFDKMYAGYVRQVQAEIKGVLQEGYAIVKDEGGSKQYKIFFIVNEEAASKARIRAIEQAAKETEVAQQYANKIADFVREGFDINQ
jgi:hypothetical protein